MKASLPPDDADAGSALKYCRIVQTSQQ